MMPWSKKNSLRLKTKRKGKLIQKELQSTQWKRIKVLFNVADCQGWTRHSQTIWERCINKDVSLGWLSSIRHSVFRLKILLSSKRFFSIKRQRLKNETKCLIHSWQSFRAACEQASTIRRVSVSLLSKGYLLTQYSTLDQNSSMGEYGGRWIYLYSVFSIKSLTVASLCIWALSITI